MTAAAITDGCSKCQSSKSKVQMNDKKHKMSNAHNIKRPGLFFNLFVI